MDNVTGNGSRVIEENNSGLTSSEIVTICITGSLGLAGKIGPFLL